VDKQHLAIFNSLVWNAGHSSIDLEDLFEDIVMYFSPELWELIRARLWIHRHMMRNHWIFGRGQHISMDEVNNYILM